MRVLGHLRALHLHSEEPDLAGLGHPAGTCQARPLTAAPSQWHSISYGSVVCRKAEEAQALETDRCLFAAAPGHGLSPGLRPAGIGAHLKHLST